MKPKRPLNHTGRDPKANRNKTKKINDVKFLYGGSVNPENIRNFKKITGIDGFLIGGASQNPKKFIDIVKKTYN